MFTHRKMPELYDLGTIEKDGKRWYILPNKDHVPSVTTVLSSLNTDRLSAWRSIVGDEHANFVSHVARSQGTAFHDLAEKYLNNEEIDLRRIMPDIKLLFQNAKSAINRIDEVYYIEKCLYSYKHRIAGKTDVVGVYDGAPSIIDFKNSKEPKTLESIKAYLFQVSLYATMLEEMIGLSIQTGVIIISPHIMAPAQVFTIKIDDYRDDALRLVRDYHSK